MTSGVTSEARVLVTIEDGVADVRLNRPDKINALDTAMFVAIAEAGDVLKADRSLRAVVLSGEGRGFCSGLDFSVFQAMAGDAAPEAVAEQATGAADGVGGPVNIFGTNGRITHLAQQVCWVWHEIEVPVIAAISGPCLGGGLQIAMGADIRFVRPDAKLSVLEMRWGLIPDMTGTWTLPRLVGEASARELTYTGRMISGDDAVRIGLASRTCDDPRGEALALASEIAANSPMAVRHAKRLISRSLEPGRTVAEHFLDERDTMASLIGSPANVEAVTAYFEQRPPKFDDVT